MSLIDKVNTDLKAAMLAKNESQLRGLRAMKAAILLAQTEAGSSGGLTEEQEIKLLQKLVKQRKESASIYRTQGREDLALPEEQEIEVIEKYLPAQMDDAELIQKIREIVSRLGVSNISEMGKVMGVASKELAGKADNRKVSDMIRSILS